MRVRRLLSAGALVALLGLSTAAGAAACSCVPIEPGKALRQADAAIVGRLVEVVPRDRLRADYRYRVQRVYKGDGLRRGGTIFVRSARQSAACGLPVQTGRSYGLLLGAVAGEQAKRRTGQPGGWTGGLCGVLAPRKLRSAARGDSRQARRTTGSSSFQLC